MTKQAPLPREPLSRAPLPWYDKISCSVLVAGQVLIGGYLIYIVIDGIVRLLTAG